MLHRSPLHTTHEEFVRQIHRGSVQTAAHRPGAAIGERTGTQLQFIPYGQTPDAHEPASELVATFGDVELEYAAIRRGAGLFDSPHLGTILVTGKDRIEFLNRMLTQELKGMETGEVRSAFWLNRQGRIQSDLLLIELGDRMLIVVDICQTASTVKTLREFVFAEDVEFKDISSEYHHIAIHGRQTIEFLTAACGLAPDRFEACAANALTINFIELTLAHHDQAGEPGFDLIVPIENAPQIWNHLLSFTQDKDVRVRPIGWYAYNIARIEAGTPLFNIDFGPTNLPHETGMLRERVSFTKGCYLGQEIVARMESLGKPKQMLVGLKMKEDLLPVADGQVFQIGADGGMGSQVGAVTSSTLSPMLSAAPIAFAMIKTAHAAIGQEVLVNAEGAQARAAIHPLKFWPSQTSAVGASAAGESA
jgi:folate-binding protein YgfZ